MLIMSQAIILDTLHVFTYLRLTIIYVVETIFSKLSKHTMLVMAEQEFKPRHFSSRPNSFFFLMD